MVVINLHQFSMLGCLSINALTSLYVMIPVDETTKIQELEIM